MKIDQEGVAREFNRVHDRYQSEVNSALAFSGLDIDFFTRVKAHYLLEILTREFGALGKLDVLDFGCGVGVYHGLLAGKFGRLSGIDVSSASIETAKRSHPEVDYTLYDGGRAPFGDNTFDALFTICVMHHVPPDNWNATVDEIGRVLRPGGLAIVFEHNPWNPLTQLVVNRCEFDRDAVLLNSRTARNLFNKKPFSEIKSRHILTIPPLVRPLYKLDHVLGYLPVGAQYYLTAKVA